VCFLLNLPTDGRTLRTATAVPVKVAPTKKAKQQASTTDKQKKKATAAAAAAAAVSDVEEASVGGKAAPVEPEDAEAEFDNDVDGIDAFPAPAPVCWKELSARIAVRVSS
jgi:hypothetical protein